MKRNRKFSFKTRKDIIKEDNGDTYYYYISDAAFIQEARRVALLNNCKFVKLRSGPLYNDRTIVIKGSRKDFVNFAIAFSLNFMKNITEMNF